MSGALVLAAHGSRRDPAANALVRRLAQAVRERRLFAEVAVAFHQGEPGFDSVLDELEAEAVTVVPVMTSAGHYADVVLPEGLARNRRHAVVRLRVTPPVGVASRDRAAGGAAGERAAAGPFAEPLGDGGAARGSRDPAPCR